MISFFVALELITLVRCMCNVLLTLSVSFARRHVAQNVDLKTTRSGERVSEKVLGESARTYNE